MNISNFTILVQTVPKKNTKINIKLVNQSGIFSWMGEGSKHEMSVFRARIFPRRGYLDKVNGRPFPQLYSSIKGMQYSDLTKFQKLAHSALPLYNNYDYCN